MNLQAMKEKYGKNNIFKVEIESTQKSKDQVSKMTFEVSTKQSLGTKNSIDQTSKINLDTEPD